ncbi:hypothetical protein [Caballeronia sordidicola]|uniref:Uncharacterized protein n=1 Tax=Caballeronia sordidicola TaxID=196367 RepID=A0A242MLG6_CABSO|nr:hypothetical protein [Caballeronia sordidicola]OTP72166.1 hypothetical protein PAMC26577_21640 [Caballeronia sordidicola]
MEDAELQRLIEISHKRRGGKATKYPVLEPVSDDIKKLMEADIALTVIRDWLDEKKGVSVVLNTLRKFVIFHIGRETYDAYLLRNGWAKNIHEKRPKKADLKQSSKTVAATSNVGDARNVMAGLNSPKKQGAYDPNPDVSHLLEIDEKGTK